MELRTVDPRSLIENPDNPRRKAPPDQADLQMAATARAIGILQPPVVREVGNKLMTIYGHRRVRGAIAAELPDLRVLVLGEAEHADDDQLRAMVENVCRKAMSPVEQWRAIEKLVSERWTEQAISTALVLPVRTLQKLRLLARIHPPMLDRMHAGDMPQERELRTIASASMEDQAAAWKKNKPRKNEDVTWWQLSQALANARTTRVGQSWYSPLAILTALTLRAVFRLAYRQAEGAYSEDCSRRFRLKPVPDSDRSQPGTPMIPAG